MRQCEPCAETAAAAVVLGCAGERLSPEERRFFAAADPLGFVLFRPQLREPAIRCARWSPSCATRSAGRTRRC